VFQKVTVSPSSEASSPGKMAFHIGLLSAEGEGPMIVQTSGTTHSMTQRHVPEDLNPQQHTAVIA
jgi:hypothetical protein